MALKKNVLALVVLAVIVLGTSFIVFSSFDSSPEIKSSAIESSVAEAESELLYGLALDGYEVETNTVGRNEFLSGILQRYDIDLQTISALADKSKPVFDVRKIGAGHDYTTFKGASGKLDYFVYQPNPIDYIVYDLRDGINVYKEQKAVTTQVETVAGVINSSLYETLQTKGVSPDLAVQLAEI